MRHLTHSRCSFAVIALLCVCPIVGAQDSEKKSEYGTVIGIGEWMCNTASAPLIHFLQTLGQPILVLSMYIAARNNLTLTISSSVQRGRRVEIIANNQGHRITLSWLGFDDEEHLYVFLSL